jgi:signal peptidase II
MIRNKYFRLVVLIFTLLVPLQALSFWSYKISSPIINDQIIFGGLSSNAVSIIISTLILALLIFFLASREKVLILWSGLLLSGSVSNIIDRVIYGGVVDYFNLANLFVFNLSDLLIIFGLSGLVFNYIKKT